MPDEREAHIAALEAELATVRAEMLEYTSAVTHDLRAPLRRIVSYAKLVQEEAGAQLDPEAQQFLATIGDSARHMGVMLDGLTTLARVASAPLDLCPVPLLEMVPQVCDGLQGRHAQGVPNWRIGTDLPVVRSDPALLQQVLVQVLDNAVKFSVGRPDPVISVSAVPTSQGGRACVEVRDNGVGFNPALHDKLFKVFGRLHSAQQFAGMGLGLVLARRIMQRLGGSVSIAATPDQGCCVRLEFAADHTEPPGHGLCAVRSQS